jgi:hypothetical protein
MDVRHRLVGATIALVVFGATAIASYAILNHFYGEGYLAISTRTIIIENSGQQVQVDGTKFFVCAANYMADENIYNLTLSPPSYDNNSGGQPTSQGMLEGSQNWINVPYDAYNQAQETGNPVTISDMTTTSTKPINALPIAASIGIAMSLIVFGVWVGYRRLWGDATSTLVDHGLQDMTVRDVEIVGEIIDMKEFTIPELMGRTHTSKLRVWRIVQKLVQRGIVKSAGKTKPAASGLGGRGKPSRVYQYIDKQKTE